MQRLKCEYKILVIKPVDLRLESFETIHQQQESVGLPKKICALTHFTRVYIDFTVIQNIEYFLVMFPRRRMRNSFCTGFVLHPIVTLRCGISLSNILFMNSNASEKTRFCFKSIAALRSLDRMITTQPFKIICSESPVRRIIMWLKHRMHCFCEIAYLNPFYCSWLMQQVTNSS